jgi:hypothetical protein
MVLTNMANSIAKNASTSGMEMGMGIGKGMVGSPKSRFKIVSKSS